jgi:hypothetical protein
MQPGKLSSFYQSINEMQLEGLKTIKYASRGFRDRG